MIKSFDRGNVRRRRATFPAGCSRKKASSLRHHSLRHWNRLQQVMRMAGGRFPQGLSLSLRGGTPLTRPPRGIIEVTTRRASTSKSTPPRKADAGLEQPGGGSTSGNPGAGTAAGAPGPTKSGVYAGGAEMPFTSRLHIADPSKAPIWPVFRVLDDDGSVRADAVEPDLSQEVALKIYGNMIRLEAMDDIFYNAQRQGRMSFYLQSAGEEALQMGAAAALDLKDMAFTQYREPGILMWRDFGMQAFADQCLGNVSDLGKGRQMPVHYGSRNLHYQTVSSPLGTQIPQAVGAGYALKMSGEQNIAVCYFGEGAASEGDFHAALGMAATRDVPVLFICRNNGFAISTSVKDQYCGDGIVSRAPGYGMHGVRVDGNDALAMYTATAEARKLCLSLNKPVLMEAMTYRLGHHSTSDDWSRYRTSDEVDQWKEKHHPIRRLFLYLKGKGWWDDGQDRMLRDKERVSVLKALETAERKAPPMMDTMFDDVYKTMPPHLQEQKDQLHAHLQRNPDQAIKAH